MVAALFAPACIKFRTTVPKAGFTFTRNCDGRGSCTVSFINTSTDAISYHWQLGDDSTSVGANPVHTYNTVNAPYYIVTLDAIGQDKEAQVTDTVYLCAYGDCL